MPIEPVALITTNLSVAAVNRAINSLNELIIMINAGDQPLDPNLTSIAELDLVGENGKVLAVNGAEDGFELVDNGVGVITQSIDNDDTTHAPSGDAVFDALALKQDLSNNLTSVSDLVLTGQNGKVIAVNVTEDGFELIAASGGASDIDGLSDAHADATNVILGEDGATITTGTSNTAVGRGALAALTEGTGNVAIGQGALNVLTTAIDNVAIGAPCLQSNTDGTRNVAIGSLNTMISNTTGSYNTVVGSGAMQGNTDGNFNVAVGVGAMAVATSGEENTVVGASAGQAITTGTLNVVIGRNAEVEAGADTNSVVIGAGAVGEGSNTVQIGNASITDVYFGDESAVLHGDGSALTNLPAGAGGLTVIASGNLATGSPTVVDITGIPQTYSGLILDVRSASNSVTTKALRVDIDTGAGLGNADNYYTYKRIANATVTAVTALNRISTDVTQTNAQSSQVLMKMMGYQAGTPKMYEAFLSAGSGSPSDGYADPMYATGILVDLAGSPRTGAVVGMRITWDDVATGDFDGGIYQLLGIT